MKYHIVAQITDYEVMVPTYNLQPELDHMIVLLKERPERDERAI